MMLTLSMSRYGGLPVNLPKTAISQQPPSETAAITIGQEGKISMDKQEVAGHQLQNVLEQRLAAKLDLLVLINADERVEHGLVVEIIDAARQAGVTKLASAVKPKESRHEN